MVMATSRMYLVEEVPGLASSDTSPDIVPSCPLGDASLSSEISSLQSDDIGQLILPGRRVVVDRSNRSAASSSSQPRHRSQSRPRSSDTATTTAASTIINGRPHRCTHPRSAARPRSRSAARRQSSRSRPRSAAREAVRPPHTRFSYSRLISIGGTTVYRTPHMARLDALLQTASGLHLEIDGKCTFLFEHQKFIIEADGETTGEFLFYASLGPLKKLQYINRPKNLLRLIATWNNELTERRGGGSRSGAKTDQLNSQESSGLLRIDSSVPDGPHVALIYYGNLDNISSAEQFQDKLDEFVDDTIEYSHKIRGTKESLDRMAGSSQTSLPPYDDSKSRSNRDSKGGNRKSSNEGPTSDESDSGRSEFNRESRNSNTKTSGGSEKSATSADSDTECAITVNRPSIFTKVMSSLHRPVVSLGYQEQDCYFVDRQAVEEGTAKLTINLSRAGVVGRDKEENDNARRTSASYHKDEKNNSRHHEATQTKSKSFHCVDNARRGSASTYKEEKNSRHYDAVQTKSKSFHCVDNPRRGGASFHMDERKTQRHDVAKTTSKSFHSVSFNDNGSSSNGRIKPKCKSYHSSFMNEQPDHTSTTKIGSCRMNKRNILDDKLHVDMSEKVSHQSRRKSNAINHSAKW